MNSKIVDIWNKLYKVNSFGLVKSLYSPDFSQYIYCTILNPEKRYGIGISYSNNININIKSFTKLQDVQVYITNDSSYNDNNILILQLLNSKYVEIFAVLCENLIHSIANLSDSDKAIHIIINQLEKWKTLFSNLNIEGLSIQEQQGLYGELYFLRKLLNHYNNNEEVLNTWIGVDRELRDFQNIDCAIEVKTTSLSNHQHLIINSERQLDETLLKNLFLYHLSVETSAQNGETLNQIVTSLKDFLESDLIALNIFSTKLMLAGYLEVQKGLYDNRAYKFRRENFYKIINDFPRIKESELRGGVGDIQYSIITDMCTEYLIPEITIFKTLGLCKN